MTNEEIKNNLNQHFEGQLSNWNEQYEQLSVEVTAANNLKVLQYLYDQLGFTFLNDLCGIHYPDTELELGVVYHLRNLKLGAIIRVKTFVSAQKPDVFSATSLFASANFMERETYDFFGINFVGHPNLIRILNVDEMDYFPLRKQYPVEDQSRIDKDDAMFGRG